MKGTTVTDPAEQTPPTPPADEPTPAAELPDPNTIQLTDAPADAADDIATGHAIYDRVLGTYVGGVYRDKAPSKAEAAKVAGRPTGHVAVVKV